MAVGLQRVSFLTVPAASLSTQHWYWFAGARDAHPPPSCSRRVGAEHEAGGWTGLPAADRWRPPAAPKPFGNDIGVTTASRCLDARWPTKFNSCTGPAAIAIARSIVQRVTAFNHARFRPVRQRGPSTVPAGTKLLLLQAVPVASWPQMDTPSTPVGGKDARCRVQGGLSLSGKPGTGPDHTCSLTYLHFQR